MWLAFGREGSSPMIRIHANDASLAAKLEENPDLLNSIPDDQLSMVAEMFDIDLEEQVQKVRDAVHSKVSIKEQIKQPCDSMQISADTERCAFHRRSVYRALDLNQLKGPWLKTSELVRCNSLLG